MNERDQELGNAMNWLNSASSAVRWAVGGQLRRQKARIEELEARERELEEMVVSAYHEGFIDGGNSDATLTGDAGWARSDSREALAKHKGEQP